MIDQNYEYILSEVRKIRDEIKNESKLIKLTISEFKNNYSTEFIRQKEGENFEKIYKKIAKLIIDNKNTNSNLNNSDKSFGTNNRNILNNIAKLINTSFS